MNASERYKNLQAAVEFDASGKELVIDGKPGPITEEAISSLTSAAISYPDSTWPLAASEPVAAQPAVDSTGAPLTGESLSAFKSASAPAPVIHSVMASSFADPADIRAFNECKAEGKSDEDCFSRGDNGIGFTGMNCGTDEVCICALPPEEWQPKWGSSKNATGRKVSVTYNGKTVVGVMGDTMPHEKSITNGCGIDLNPGFVKAFGLRQPLKIPVMWQWAM